MRRIQSKLSETLGISHVRYRFPFTHQNCGIAMGTAAVMRHSRMGIQFEKRVVKVTSSCADTLSAQPHSWRGSPPRGMTARSAGGT